MNHMPLLPLRFINLSTSKTIVDNELNLLATVHDTNAAHYIVKCVNLHNELVAALQDVLDDHIDGQECDCSDKIKVLLARAK